MQLARPFSQDVGRRLRFQPCCPARNVSILVKGIAADHLPPTAKFFPIHKNIRMIRQAAERQKHLALIFD
jgi:hypothetical protein